MYRQNISTICNLYLILTTIIIKTATTANATSESCRSYYSRESNPPQSESVQLNNPRTNEHVSIRMRERYDIFEEQNCCQYLFSWCEHNVFKKTWFIISCLSSVVFITGFIGIYLTAEKIRVCGGWYNYIFDLCLLPHLNPT
ncbi:hypothetical protein NBO_3g0045 [Nosema bombycis CQ1]|uniref:Uncharacterized protein n=1 Tax=Nosema bombycis (strain CQ1 / CVCC 102059) TaxID=578461 RepID=R0MC08_NOSB1|nr:hypothetical protein NBO_3g0045 [Nosema bombycis CQ1]|eukprot:EOB15494.1 hypothetical protein NBO_3g0045 [Nosema bombycis CQ1]